MAEKPSNDNGSREPMRSTVMTLLRSEFPAKCRGCDGHVGLVVLQLAGRVVRGELSLEQAGTEAKVASKDTASRCKTGSTPGIGCAAMQNCGYRSPDQVGID